MVDRYKWNIWRKILHVAYAFFSTFHELVSVLITYAIYLNLHGLTFLIYPPVKCVDHTYKEPGVFTLRHNINFKFQPLYWFNHEIIQAEPFNR